jgi:hypothetical protein
LPSPDRFKRVALALDRICGLRRLDEIPGKLLFRWQEAAGRRSKNLQVITEQHFAAIKTEGWGVFRRVVDDRAIPLASASKELVAGASLETFT